MHKNNRIFKYKEDILPFTIIVSLFAFDVVVYSIINSLAFLLIRMVFSSAIKCIIVVWNHHHHHVNTFMSSVLNRFFENILGLQTGISAFTWTLHHNFGHHINYLDQKKDQSKWQHKNGNTMSAGSYTFITTITCYWRAFKVGARE